MILHDTPQPTEQEWNSQPPCDNPEAGDPAIPDVLGEFDPTTKKRKREPRTTFTPCKPRTGSFNDRKTYGNAFSFCGCGYPAAPSELIDSEGCAKVRDAPGVPSTSTPSTTTPCMWRQRIVLTHTHTHA